MSTVSEIATALAAAIATAVSDVDVSGLDGYEPPITTAKTALICPGFGLRGSVDYIDLQGSVARQTTRVPLELWTKIDTGNLESCFTRARNVCQAAAHAVMAGPTLGGIVRGLSDPIEYTVMDEPWAVGGAAYVRAILYVPVEDETAL